MHAHMTKPAVLVVDDELGVREAFRLILEEMCEVYTAPDGATALNLLSRHPIPLAILDLRLPDLHGLEVLRRMNALDTDLGVIVVTAGDEVTTAVQAMQAGALESLVKPCDSEGLQRTVARALAQQARRTPHHFHSVSPAAMEALQAYDWPGNMRELENVVERLVISCAHEVIRLRDLPCPVRARHLPLVDRLKTAGFELREAVQTFERDFIRKALEQAQWNQTAAARLLGIHRNTLLAKMEQLGL